MPVIARRMATSVDSSPIVVSASVIGIPALTNTDSCRVKFIKFFFFAFSFVSSKLEHSPRLFDADREEVLLDEDRARGAERVGLGGALDLGAGGVDC